MNWNAELYDTQHAFVSQYGESLVGLLAPKAGESILDLGCGTGQLANQIALLGAQVRGVDNSASMIEKAKLAYPAISFEVMDVTEMPFEGVFDAVFSNAVLHWVLDKEKAIERMYASLKPGGRLVVEFGGKGNVKSIIDTVAYFLKAKGYAVNHYWYFPSIGEYAGLLEKQGFQVKLALHFDRETELTDSENGVIDWLQMFGAGYFSGVSPADKTEILEQCKEHLRSRFLRDGKLYADYKRLRIVAVKV